MPSKVKLTVSSHKNVMEQNAVQYGQGNDDEHNQRVVKKCC